MNKDHWVYLSHFYNSETPGYGGKQSFFTEEDRCILKGDKCNQFKFSMGNHTGTHIDLPRHFYANGKLLQDYTPADWFFTHVECAEIILNKNELICSHHLPSLNKEVDCLLLKTGFEQYRAEQIYWSENPGLTAELSSYLKDHYKNLKVICLDFISATAFQQKEEGRLAHLAFLNSDNEQPILIVEDAKLDGVCRHTQIELLHIAPWLIESADGVPVTISAKISKD